jgi:arylsulfatase A-like enzyme
MLPIAIARRLPPVFACLLCSTAALKAEEKTNVLFILTDDQGAWTLGCYGNKEAHTPRLDRLATEGVRLINAFATTPVCSPSRGTFFTGRIPSQHGIHDWIKHENMGDRARFCMADEVFLSDILTRQGYVCGLSGKWHLGDSLRPHAGFTFWFALPQGSSPYNDADMIWDGKVIKTEGYLTDRITDRAIDFLDANKDRPFFLYVGYNAPHSPYNGHPKELVDLFKDCPFDSVGREPLHPNATHDAGLMGNRKLLSEYFAACSGIDRGVARLLAALDEQGLAEKTLVVFTSDQGFCTGQLGFWGKGNGTNPRNMYDVPLRTPMIFRHPGRIPAGRTLDAMISVYDFVPTILDYLGLPPSPGRNLPGRSFAPQLRGQQQPDWPEAVFAEYGHTRAIRTRTAKYVHRADGGPHELYDLEKDPSEKQNLAGDPSHRRQLVALRTRIFEWFERYAEAGADPIGQEYIRPADK